MIVGIDHVSMAPADVEEAFRLFALLGLKEGYSEDLAAEGVRSRQLDAGNCAIEILQAMRPDAPVQRWLERRGQGLHHICFRVDSLEATIQQVQAAGLELVSPAPREDGQGRRVFLHPRSGCGVLMGLVERFPDSLENTQPEQQPHAQEPTVPAGQRTVNPGWRSYERLTYAPAVAARGEMLFTAGLNAIDEDGMLQAPGDIVGQARVIYQKLDALLRAAGGSLANVVKTTDYITTRENYRLTADVRREVFGDRFPAATGVVVAELLGRGVLIEIDAVAVLE